MDGVKRYRKLPKIASNEMKGLIKSVFRNNDNNNNDDDDDKGGSVDL